MKTRLLGETAAAVEAQLTNAVLEPLRTQLDGPLAVVASGGTLTAAALWALLHSMAGGPAWTLSPYALTEQGVPQGTRVLLLSAGGGHHDILRAARYALDRGWPTFAVTCTQEAPLMRMVYDAGGREAVFVLPSPPHADALLPVHTLLPLLVLAARLYGGPGPWADRFTTVAAPVPARRPRLVVALGVGAAMPAAIDFADKVQESGLAPAWHTDVRDFSHGSFLTLTEAPEETLLVIFAAGQQRAYLERWTARLPSSVPIVRIEVEEDGPGAALSLLARGLCTFEALANAVGLSLGHERIPTWGRGIYLLEI